MEGSRGGPVVVVGAGIVGCAIAVHLADQGVRPVVVAPDRPAASASASSFASLSAFGKDPVAWYELACAGMASWSRWAERLGGRVGLRREGEIRWAGDPREGEDLAERVARARRSGYPIRVLGEAELRHLLPTAEPGRVAAACFAPGDGQVEPPLVLQACRDALRQAGAHLLLGRTARIGVDDGGVRVEVGGELLRPSVTVLAAGAEAVAVAAAVGLEIPTVASPGMLVETHPLPPLTAKVVYLPGDPGPPVHLRQRQDGSVLVGERSQEMVAVDPSDGHARELLAQAARFFPALRGVPARRRILAWRAMPADRLPILGPVPWLDELYVAVTHSGVTVAPALGRLVAREIVDGEPDGLLAPFRPGRFAERASRVLLEVESVFRERPPSARPSEPADASTATGRVVIMSGSAARSRPCWSGS
jgi:glycine/D-amino acid oxidase-like deaminating enzyme